MAVANAAAAAVTAIIAANVATSVQELKIAHT